MGVVPLFALFRPTYLLTLPDQQPGRDERLRLSSGHLLSMQFSSSELPSLLHLPSSFTHRRQPDHIRPLTKQHTCFWL